MGKTQDNKSKRKDAAATARRRRGPIARRLLYWGLVAGLWGVIGLGGLIGYYAYTLPTPHDLRQGWRTPSIILVARDGAPVHTVGRRRGAWLPYEAFPEPLVQALLATEDRRFFDHGAVDFVGLARAALANLRAGRVVEGGSTITQQLAKNLFLSQERTVKRKIQEMLLAVWLETKYTKKEILTFYLNRMYLGGGAYGVDAAARLYFGHSARRLDLAQSAVLVGLLKAPSRLSPHENPTAAWARARVVLGAMTDAGYLPETAMRRAADARPEFAPRRRPSEALYFIDWVRRNLVREIGRPKEDVFVRTTLDPAMQEAAASSLSRALAESGGREIGQAALLAMASDGAVHAMLGGRRYADSQYNRAIQARRQPGSAFKLFVYLTAFEAGLTPETVMRDAPITLSGWSPQNYAGGHRGPVTLETAFADSINTVAVKLSERVNRRRVIDMAHRLGATAELTPHPSLALGSSEMSLTALTAAYAAVANGGWRVEPFGIVEVRSTEGAQLFKHETGSRSHVLAPGAVRDMRRLLVSAMQSGTAQAARLDRPAAGKTGTSQDYRDAWFIGFTADLVTGVWMGNDDGTPMNRVTGGGPPAALWRDFMTATHADIPPRPLPSVGRETAGQERATVRDRMP